MESTDNHKLAYKYCLRLLAKRDYSKKTLVEKLKLREYSPEVITKTIDQLIEDRYLREDHYTKIKIRSLIQKNFSPSIIIKQLRQEDITITHAEINQVYEELNLTLEDQINAMISKKIPKLIPSDYAQKQKIKQKLIYQLMKKGHSIYDSREILSIVLNTKVC